MAALLASSPLHPRFTLGSFVRAPSNELAYAAVMRLVESRTYNPLYIYSEAGLGKTHLLQAATRALLASGRKAAYLTVEAVTHLVVRPYEFADALDTVHILLLDDFELFARHPDASTCYSCILLYINSGGRLVVAANAPPLDLPGLTRDVSSRLEMGLVAPIGAMDFDIRARILRIHEARIQEQHPAFTLGEGASNYLASRRGATGRDLEGVMNRLEAEYALRPRTFGVDELRAFVRVIMPEAQGLTIEEIQNVVVEFYRVRMADMASPRRARVVARPRQVAMFLAKELTGRSLPEIGRRFGGRDHTTVMHACKKVAELMARQKVFADEVEELRRRLIA